MQTLAHFGHITCPSSGSYNLVDVCIVDGNLSWITGRLYTYHSFATRVSQLKICDFSGKNFKGFEVL